MYARTRNYGFGADILSVWVPQGMRVEKVKSCGVLSTSGLLYLHISILIF